MIVYSCSQCNATIEPAQLRCHQCGSEIDWAAAVGRVQYVQRLRRLSGPRGPRFRTLLGFSALLVLVLGLALVMGLWRVEQGLQEGRAALGDATFDRYRQGLVYVLDGRWQDARAQFSRPLAARPEPVMPLPSPTPQPAPPPAASPAAVLEEIVAQAQVALDAGQWDQAIAQLTQLRDLDPAYQAGLVGQMLFNAHYQQALAWQAAGDLAAAAQALEAALALRPGNTAALALKQALDLYRGGQAALGRDWQAAIVAFGELYALDRDFLDTPDQLFSAFAGHGAALHDTAPCQAVERYQQALQLRRDPQVRARLEDARLRCQEGNGQIATGAGGVTPPAYSGRIAYTLFDDVRTWHLAALWHLAAGATEPAIIAPRALQPHIGPDGSVVVRSTEVDRYGLAVAPAPGAQPQRLTKGAGDSLPRWSPDGSRILFHSASRSEDGRWRLYLVQAATGEVQDLGLGRGGAWAPDGQRIVYQGCDAGGAGCGLWVLNLEDGSRQQLTAVDSDSYPAWSQDGRLIAFMSAGRSPSWDLFVVDAGTGSLHLFALDDGRDGLPAWAPDGGAIAFLSDREGVWGVYAWSLEDLSVQQLFTIPGTLPSWQEAGLSWAP